MNVKLMLSQLSTKLELKLKLKLSLAKGRRIDAHAQILNTRTRNEMCTHVYNSCMHIYAPKFNFTRRNFANCNYKAAYFDSYVHMCRIFQYKNCQAKERRMSTHKVDDYSVAKGGDRCCTKSGHDVSFIMQERGKVICNYVPYWSVRSRQSPLQHHTLQEHLHGIHVGNHGFASQKLIEGEWNTIGVVRPR